MGAKYILALLLVILAACEEVLQSVPTSEYEAPQENTASNITPIKVSACANVTCQAGQTCTNGACACPRGGKLCNNKCIPQSACCTDNDCENGTCKNQTCSTNPTCKLNEEYVSGECGCAQGYKFCREQNKCIEMDSCCYQGNCNYFQHCVPTVWRVSLCMKAEQKKSCRVLADNNKSEYLTIENSSFKVGAQKWLNDGSVVFSVDNATLPLKTNVSTTFANFTVYQEGIQTIGGFCKEDDEP